jgi:hypothetical protein
MRYSHNLIQTKRGIKRLDDIKRAAQSSNKHSTNLAISQSSLGD